MTESNTIGFLNHLFEPLVRYDIELKIEPALAESWEIVDATTWRFHLRRGVTFHNGNPFTADDVVASILRAVDPSSPVKSNLPGVNEAKKVDDFTVDRILDGLGPEVPDSAVDHAGPVPGHADHAPDPRGDARGPAHRLHPPPAPAG